MSSKPPSTSSASSVTPESENGKCEIRLQTPTQRSEIGNGSVVATMTDAERDELLQSVSIQVDRIDIEVEAMAATVTSAGRDVRETRDAQRVIESDVREIRDGQNVILNKLDAITAALDGFKDQFRTTVPIPPPEV